MQFNIMESTNNNKIQIKVEKAAAIITQQQAIISIFVLGCSCCCCLLANDKRIRKG